MAVLFPFFETYRTLNLKICFILHTRQKN